MTRPHTRPSTRPSTRQRRPSSATIKILNCLSDAPQGLHGYGLMKAAGLASGTLYPILARLAERGWLEKNWDMDPEASGPPRRIYTLTPVGRAQLDELASPPLVQTQRGAA